MDRGVILLVANCCKGPQVVSTTRIVTSPYLNFVAVGGIPPGKIQTVVIRLDGVIAGVQVAGNHLRQPVQTRG